MSLRIAQIAPLGSGLPPASYGGTELMVLLAEELMRRGHDVTLFAPDDTLTEMRLEAARRTASDRRYGRRLCL
jgi:hypothetical protein